MSDPAPDRMPIEQQYHDIVFVSDLHLGNGYSRTTGRYDPREDFFYDAEFHRFVQYLIRQGHERNRPQRLIVLGDVFEFLQTDGRPYNDHGLPEQESPAFQDREVQEYLNAGKPFNGLSTTPTATVWRLERVARGHPEWFRTLGEFLQSDPHNRLDIVVGNHDIEMTWPEAQTRFKQLIEAQVSTAGLGERIAFYPWFIYEPGLFYAEHGQQYDSFNSFATLMSPILPTNDQLVELPLGSFFVRYVFNQIESSDPFADNIRPMTRYVAWALRHNPVRGLRTLFFQARLLIRVLRKTSELTPAQQRERRERYHREVVTPYAAKAGLRPEQLIAIDKLAVLPSMASRWAQAEQVVFEPLIPLLWILAPLATIFGALRRASRGVRAFATFIAGFLGLLYRERKTFNPPQEPESHLRDAARKIHYILDQHGDAVRFYIFGHTHQAEVFPLFRQQDEPRYLNTGTWTPIIDPDAQLLRGVVQLNFVQILRNDNGYELAELLFWNDGAERPQLVPLVD